MKKSLLTFFVLALTSSAFAGTVGMVEKPEDCAMLNNSTAVIDVIEPDVTPDVIDTDNSANR